MEYEITFTVPDELSILLDMSERRRRYLDDKIQEFIRELLARELTNAVDRGLIQVRPHLQERQI